MGLYDRYGRIWRALAGGLTVLALAGCLTVHGQVPSTAPRPLTVVPAPVPPDGYVVGQPTHVVFVLVPDTNPAIHGLALQRGESLTIVLPTAFARNPASSIQEDSDQTMVLTKGWPQAPVRQAGQYRIFYDAATHTIGVRAEQDITTDGANAPGIKMMHLRGATFLNPQAGNYPVEVRLIGQNGTPREVWTGTMPVRSATMTARLAPTNFHLGPGVNADFQQLGPKQDTPLVLGVYLWDQMGKPINSVGIGSPDLAHFPKYNGGLLIQDTNGDRRLDPSVDRVIGGIIIEAPPGATGQAVSSPSGDDGRLVLSGEMSRSPTFPVAAGGGKLDPGLLPIRVHSGSTPGVYRLTVALIDGNSYPYTVTVE
jgi:hypothetical protein